MAKGHQAKLKKSDTSPSKKSTKTKTVDSVQDRHAVISHAKCIDCKCVIMDDTRALNCERCAVNWKCSGCVGIRNATYDDLITEAGSELHWFCEPCYAAVIKPQDDGMIVQVLQKLTQQLTEIEEKLDNKVDCAKVDDLEKIVRGMETKVNDGYKGVIMSLEKSTSVLEQSKFDVSAVQGCVEGVLEVQRVQSLEEKNEEEDRERRKNNVIIHGFPEPRAAEADDRKKEDCDRAQELLHKLSCDDVSVKRIARLGPPPTGSGNRPRPVKLDLSSAESCNKVLKQAKNLRSAPEDHWKNVFVQQDFTPRERAARRILVQELKARKEAGETDLIIVNAKIVKKRTYEY